MTKPRDSTIRHPVDNGTSSAAHVEDTSRALQPDALHPARTTPKGCRSSWKMPLYIRLALILFLVAGNAFFVGSEIAISSARRSRIRQLAEEGNKRAATVHMFHNEPERFYSVTQVGIILVSLGGAPRARRCGHGDAERDLRPVVRLALLVLRRPRQPPPGGTHGVLRRPVHRRVIRPRRRWELAPKVLAFHKAEKISLSVGSLINVLYLTFRPLIAVMKAASDLLLRISGQRNLRGHGESHFTMSVEEIWMILTASEKDGMLDPEESEMIRGVFELDEQTVRDAMIPRTQIRAL